MRGEAVPADASPEGKLSLCIQHEQEGSKATVVFCQQGSTTVRCLQVSQLTPVKGSKEKPGTAGSVHLVLSHAR